MRGIALFVAVLTLSMVLGERTVSTRGPASEREPTSSSFTCKLVTGYGTAIGRGSSKTKAKEAAMEACGTAMINDYYARRGKIDPEAELELACINLECS